MSARLEQLVQDLANSGRTAEPAVRSAHLRALRGALLAAGERLQPAAVAAVADTLKDTMKAAAGESERARVRVCAGKARVWSAIGWCEDVSGLGEG